MFDLFPKSTKKVDVNHYKLGKDLRRFQENTKENYRNQGKKSGKISLLLIIRIALKDCRVS